MVTERTLRQCFAQGYVCASFSHGSPSQAAPPADDRPTQTAPRALRPEYEDDKGAYVIIHSTDKSDVLLFFRPGNIDPF